jgi:hypothetical protein
MTKPLQTNSRRHLALQFLSKYGAATELQISKELGMGSDSFSVRAMRVSVLEPLELKAAVVQTASKRWDITSQGHQILNQMKPIEYRMVYTDGTPALPRSYNVFEGVYVPPKPIGQRPGADQCKQYPSVQGNRRVFQNGTVEFIG